MENGGGRLEARLEEDASHGGVRFDQQQTAIGGATMVFGATSGTSSGTDGSGKGSSNGRPEIAADTLEDLASQ